MSKPEIQILLCGVGGQGINGTTRRLHEHCLSQGWHCLSAVYKGGAQRLGSVKAEIRLFPLETSEVEHKSSQIMPGTLDVLVVLEQWEGLRSIPMCNKNTLLVIDDYIEFPQGIETHYRYKRPQITLGVIFKPHHTGRFQATIYTAIWKYQVYGVLYVECHFCQT